MERTIWKYELSIADSQTVSIPEGAEILSVANQNGILCLWAMVDPGKRNQGRQIEIVGTGHLVERNEYQGLKFIGTAIINSFVWHVFERIYP